MIFKLDVHIGIYIFTGIVGYSYKMKSKALEAFNETKLSNFLLIFNYYTPVDYSFYDQNGK